MEIFSNIGFSSCISTAVIFFIFVLIFHFGGEKSANLINGFNFFTESQKAEYDVTRIVKDYRNNFLIWTLVMVIGAVLSYILSAYCAIPAFIILFILIFKDFHMFPENEFAKYKKNDKTP